MWIFLLKLKSNVSQVFFDFLPFIQRLFNSKLLVLQTDGGGEFTPVTSICKTFGIMHHFSCPHAHQQNGLVERKHRHIVEIGLAHLAPCTFPPRFWVEAFETAVYLINLLP